MEFFSLRSLLALLRGKEKEARPFYVLSDNINYNTSDIVTKLTVLAWWDEGGKYRSNYNMLSLGKFRVQ